MDVAVPRSPEAAPATTTAAVSKKLVTLRNDVGAMALGRVLTLIIVVDGQHGIQGAHPPEALAEALRKRAPPASGEAAARGREA